MMTNMKNESGSDRIRRLIADKGQLLTIGAHDGLSGLLGERAGFDALWASGLEISASHGLPDANILDMSVHLAGAAQIYDVVSIPVIADVDSGYGNAVNAAYTAKKFASVGIAGICIEDNFFPKRNSFYTGTSRELVSTKEHALKVQACKDSTDGELYVIARTEALIAGFSMEEALDRAYAYAEAGADAILIHSKEKSPEQIIEFSNRWSGTIPLVAVPTTYNTITAKELGELGYRIVIFANHGLRASIKAVQNVYSELIVAGRACVLEKDIVSLKTVFELVGVKALEEMERRYMPSMQLDRNAPTLIEEVVKNVS